jgi:hypothetical protein
MFLLWKGGAQGQCLYTALASISAIPAPKGPPGIGRGNPVAGRDNPGVGRSN